jgi:hypothetical protein
MPLPAAVSFFLQQLAGIRSARLRVNAGARL